MMDILTALKNRVAMKLKRRGICRLLCERRMGWKTYTRFSQSYLTIDFFSAFIIFDEIHVLSTSYNHRQKFGPQNSVSGPILYFSHLNNQPQDGSCYGSWEQNYRSEL